MPQLQPDNQSNIWSSACLIYDHCDRALHLFQLDFEDEPDDEEESGESSAEERDSDSEDDSFEDALENLKITEVDSSSEAVPVVVS